MWGIVLLMASGFLNFVLAPASPSVEVLAALFGIGAGLTLDEFALWIHLEDVYWSNEGRSSIDAVIVAALLGGLVVLGIAPFDLSNRAAPIESLLVAVAISLLFSVLAILRASRCSVCSVCSCRSSRPWEPSAWRRPTRRGRAGAIRPTAAACPVRAPALRVSASVVAGCSMRSVVRRARALVDLPGKLSARRLRVAYSGNALFAPSLSRG